MNHTNIFEQEAFQVGFARGIEKDAFIGRGVKALGSLVKGTKNLASSTTRAVKSTAQAGLGRAQAIQRGAQAHLGGAKRYISKNYQAGLKGSKGIDYSKAVSTEKGMLTRRANQQAAQKAKALKTQQLASQKAQRKAMKQQGTQQAAARAAKPLPNQKAKMSQTVNQRINQRGDVAKGIQPKGPAQSKINRIQNAPLSPKDVAQNKILRQGREAWGKLTPGQKGLAKGTAVGAGVVGGANMLSSNSNSQPQGYYRQ